MDGPDVAPLPVEVTYDAGGRQAQPVEVAAYYVIAEALTNVAKYAQADAATVALSVGDDRVRLEIRDDGIGGADSEVGGGVAGLCDRVEALDGALTVESPPGGGTS